MSTFDWEFGDLLGEQSLQSLYNYFFQLLVYTMLVDCWIYDYMQSSVASTYMYYRWIEEKQWDLLDFDVKEPFQQD